MIFNKTFIVAEMSANHNHKIENALAIIKAAKEAGADAVKFQTYTADTITLDCDNEYFQIQQGTFWDGMTLYKLYEQAYTPWEWHKELFEDARSLGLVAFSTPFDKTAVDFLEEIGNPIYKIASFEITDTPLIEYAASKHKPMIISTGIATEQEITEAVEACRKVGNSDITLLKCTSEYPAKIEDANLLTIPDMAKRWGVHAGLSDHTAGDACACASVALGASIVEKHFTIDRSLGGPDAAFSMNREEFSGMVKRIRETEAALGKVSYELTDKVKKDRHFARSLFAVKDIKAGDVFTEDNVRSIRPGEGCSPKFLPKLLGKTADREYKRGTPIEWKK